MINDTILLVVPLSPESFSLVAIPMISAPPRFCSLISFSSERYQFLDVDQCENEIFLRAYNTRSRYNFELYHTMQEPKVVSCDTN